MFAAWHDGLSALVAMLLVGAAIKSMDDALDADYDICHGQRTLSARIGKGLQPYVVILAMLAAVANVHVALAIMLASLAVGMLSGFRRSRKTVAIGITQAVCSLGLSIWISGMWTTLWAVAMLALADWLDDLVDVPIDKQSGQYNLVIRWGMLQMLSVALLAFGVAVVANALYTVLAMIALPIINVLAELTTSHLWKTTDEETHHRSIE